MLGLVAAASAQDTGTLFPHSHTIWFLSGQINFVTQAHGAFSAEYSGANSLRNTPEAATSRLLTLYSGLQLSPHFEVVADLEESGGSGLSGTLGLAGFTNLDAVRDPNLAATPYLSRLLVHWIVPVGDGTAANAATPLGTYTALPRRRIEFYVGKFSIVDFFDVNSVSGSSHLQFLNWTIGDNGAFDYAADTRGYTVGAMAQYEAPRWGVRFAEALMPTVANGPNLQWNPTQARSENLEFEFRPDWGFWRTRAATVRLLGFSNQGNFGSYRQAIASFESGTTPIPEITSHPAAVRSKPGAGLNFEQQIGGGLGIFGRFGWASGKFESYAYTEVEQSVSGGLALLGGAWRRPQDECGVGFAVNGVAGDHRRYLALGGQGFLLGDGALRYGHERIAEVFYTMGLGHGVSLAPDAQLVVNPGYNRSRGPAAVYSLRTHMDF